ncbi:Exocyst complex component EXO84B [Linum perenne]
MRGLSIGDSAELEENHEREGNSSPLFVPHRVEESLRRGNAEECLHQLRRLHPVALSRDLNSLRNHGKSREITDLEGQLLSMRNLLSTQGNLVHALAEQERIDSLWVGTDQTLKEDLSQIDKTELSKTEEWLNPEASSYDTEATMCELVVRPRAASVPGQLIEAPIFESRVG